MPVAGGRRLELSRMRRAVARSMLRSWQTVPQFSVSRSFDAGAILELRRALAGQRGREGPLRLSLTDFLVQAVAQSLLEFPALNATFEEGAAPGEGALVFHDEVAVGLATVLEEGGLLVPVLHHAERLALGEIASRRARLVEAARAGRLPPEAMSGGTFTLSNLGPFGVDAFRAICNPGEAAILAVGAVREQAVVRGGEVVVRPVATLTLTVDHRAADGAEAARFLAALVARLESREGWLLF
ncbi:MAG: 2-oxo acid dehydrogenase subunit E2 [Bacillota bacterium]|nr:2-oxo acid dehydrogenase subunit E2 [Bacillota bacterium]